MQSAVSSRTNRIGDTLDAIVSRDVKDGGGGVAIPAGSRVTLSIADLQAGTDAAGAEGTLALTVSSVTVDTRAYPMTAQLHEVPHHLEWRATTPLTAQHKYRDVIVSPGTPVVFTFAQAVQVSSR